jgi:tetratricopeptide (TPR) repeat protein
MALSILHRALLAGLFCALLHAQTQHRDLKISRDSANGLDQRSRLWAVVVGISHYDNVPPQAQLRFADRDAQAFAAFLRSPAGGGFPSDHVQILLNDKASLSALRTALGTWYRDALRFFQSAASLAPAWALPHLHLGLQYQAQGEKSAEQEFKTAVQLDPRQPLLREALAGYYRTHGRNQDAEQELSKLVQVAPGYAPAYRELGQLYEITRDYARAAEAFENYLRLAPDAPDRAVILDRIAKARTEKKPPTLKR